MGKLYGFLGLSCSAVQSGMTNEQYKCAYKCDIVYVTGQELGFTYLRDNTALAQEDLVGGGVQGRAGRGRGGRARSWTLPARQHCAHSGVPGKGGARHCSKVCRGKLAGNWASRTGGTALRLPRGTSWGRGSERSRGDGSWATARAHPT